MLGRMYLEVRSKSGNSIECNPIHPVKNVLLKDILTWYLPYPPPRASRNPPRTDSPDSPPGVESTVGFLPTVPKQVCLSQERGRAVTRYGSQISSGAITRVTHAQAEPRPRIRGQKSDRTHKSAEFLLGYIHVFHVCFF